MFKGPPPGLGAVQHGQFSTAAGEGLYGEDSCYRQIPLQRHIFFPLNHRAVGTDFAENRDRLWHLVSLSTVHFAIAVGDGVIALVTGWLRCKID